VTMYRAVPEHGVAWVTGAGSGIGRAVAIHLAAQGFTVAITGRRLEALEDVVRETSHLKGRVIAHPGDVSNAAHMAEIVSSIEAVHGPVALSFLNAGVAPYVKAESLDIAAFQQSMNINFMGAVHALGPLLERMKQRGRGQIAVNASVAGYGGLPQAAAYGASKAAVIHMCEALKFDCDRMGITLQVVNPGFVDTPLTRKNDFPMPFVVTEEKAAERILQGLQSGGFEITFPRRLAWSLKALNLLPYSLYFRLVARITGWK
jgi:NAD(P)-dependent dehydrogenase (short-subunit alcohol dehydrogenase family)